MMMSYADEVTLVLIGKDNLTLQNFMQLYLCKVVDWLGGWGLTVNPSKSSMHWFSRIINADISIKIDSFIVSCVRQQRLSGVILDMPMLIFHQHINYIISDVYMRVNLKHNSFSV